MKSNTRKRLEAAGARITTVQEFLGLSDAEMAVVEIKIALAKALRQQRRSAELTQQEAAKLFGSSQSRVAKMEAGDPTVSMDLLVCSLLKLGASTVEVGQVIEGTSIVSGRSSGKSKPGVIVARATASPVRRQHRTPRRPSAGAAILAAKR
jgi:transcriptional regulator with XRE-family HTH domain